MRNLFTTKDALARGLTEAELRWGEKTGRWRRVMRSVYGEGPQAPSPLDRAVADFVRTGAPARGAVAGILHELDDVPLTAVRRLPPLISSELVVVAGVACADGLQTLVDLASVLNDLRWEQVMESGLRKRLVSVGDLELVLPGLGRARSPGTTRMRRVLDLRPRGAPPTESLLETLMVQLARQVEGLAPPVRQYELEHPDGRSPIRIDLSWPELGLFVELDGQQHKGQPQYDASRETAVVAATGWLCGRFTWSDVVYRPRSTARRLADLVRQARLRPLAI